VSPSGRATPPASAPGVSIASTASMDLAVASGQATAAGPSAPARAADPTPSPWPRDKPLGASNVAAMGSGSGPSAKGGSGTPWSGKKPAGKAVRKGGLSMFLAGDLEKPLTPPPPPAAPVTPGPSWRTATGAVPRVSLLNIQSEEAAMASTPVHPLRPGQASRPVQRGGPGTSCPSPSHARASFI
jgi:hypothetical protein